MKQKKERLLKVADEYRGVQNKVKKMYQDFEVKEGINAIQVKQESRLERIEELRSEVNNLKKEESEFLTEITDIDVPSENVVLTISPEAMEKMRKKK